MKLEGKTAVVAGGGTGIGLAVAEAMAAEGCQVMIAGRREDVLADAARASASLDRLIVQQSDVADRESVAAMFAAAEAKLGRVDILVNAAGINVPKRAIGELAPDDWDLMMAVNATGTFNTMHAALPAMRERGDGVIVNISSIAGTRGDLRGGAGYSAAKFAQSGLGMTIGAEVGGDGVRITNIYPGETNTPILDKRPVPLSNEHRASILQPEDVAAAVLMVVCLPPRAHVPELVITPTWQPYM
ncbi:MAG: SDR family oxidoreductase [Pirellulales bacterium]|nr:SDR family oxidoreductase [Pirellulales bacterium]